jgi:molybdopterin converting factor small subunit
MSKVEVRLAALLHSYTRGRSTVSASGSTLGDVLDDLDRRYPGLRFRIVDEQSRLRRHVRFFINGTDARDLTAPLHPGDKLYIVGALSGG